MNLKWELKQTNLKISKERILTRNITMGEWQDTKFEINLH